MAYVNLLNQNCADKAEVFTRIRDFICKRNGTHDYSTTGIGWTLIDSSYAVDEDNPQLSDWCVFKSTGESEKDTLHIKLIWNNTTYISSIMYLTWNTTSHTGSIATGGANSMSTSETNVNTPLYIYGNLDFVSVLHKFANTDAYYRTMFFGKCSKPFSGMGIDIATSAGALTVGVDVAITVDSVPATWRVGREIYIWTTTDTIATSKVEKTEIKTLIGNTVTCDLSNSYTTNSRLSEHIGYVCQQGLTSTYLSFLISPSGTLSSQYSSTFGYDTNFAGTNMDPGSYENRWGMSQLSLPNSFSGVIGFLPKIYRISKGLLSLEDVLKTLDETEYRFLQIPSNVYLVFEEV